MPQIGTSALMPGVGSSPTLAFSRSGVAATSPFSGAPEESGRHQIPSERGQLLQGFAHLEETGGGPVVQVAVVGELDGHLRLLPRVEQKREQRRRRRGRRGGRSRARPRARTPAPRAPLRPASRRPPPAGAAGRPLWGGCLSASVLLVSIPSPPLRTLREKAPPEEGAEMP